MNRSQYFNYIEEKISILAGRIEVRGKLNILDLHGHSEDFYSHFLKELYDWKLDNLNKIKYNVESIDLIEKSKKYVVQVSATNTKEKIEAALNKEIIKKHSDHTFKFISIAKDASALRKKTYNNPYGVGFTPLDDIVDKISILSSIKQLDIDRQKEIYYFIKKELGGDIDIVKLDSNLAAIINILAKEDLKEVDSDNKINSFEIERKIGHNELDKAKMIIQDYAIYHSRLNNKYKEFDSQGANKSYSVLQAIRSIYIEECIRLKEKDADFLFLEVVENVKKKIIQSANYMHIPIDELELCVNIIVVDAFIRCKIFKDPEGYNYVAT